MKSAIYRGEIYHARLRPVRHVFRYPVYTYAVDLDELPELDRRIPLFGYNRFRPVAIHEKDYLGGGNESLRERVEERLRQQGCAETPARVILVTSARFLNYVFNPVSFFYCLRKDGSLLAAIAEVNNTFGETHLYVLTEPGTAKSGFLARYTVDKDFHVSPFNDRKGLYDFHFSELGERLNIRINILRDGEKAFLSGIQGQRLPLNSRNLTRTVLRFPLTAVATMPRILWQAAKLHYGKGLAVYTKPNPDSAMTIRQSPPGWSARLGMKFSRKIFGMVRRGRLTVGLPNGESWRFGGHEPGPSAALTVRNYDFFTKLVKEGDIGFGRSFIDGDWETEDLVGLMELFTENYAVAAQRSTFARTLGRIGQRAWNAATRNTRNGSRRNIAYHYDLGNAFYKLFLDEGMLYSSAVFASPDETLEQAQRNKVNGLIAKARLDASHHLLEIGSGWGTFAIEAARQTGCRVTTVTLSREQYEYAKDRIRDAGLEDRVEIRLQDYRDVEGQFDRVVSIEMLEAVGHENLGTYFATCERLLKPDGLAVLQVITLPDQRYKDYLRDGDYIQRFVFPGAVCPSLGAINDALRRDSGFFVEALENIGPHYARTLQEWRERFLAQRHEVRRLGFDERFERLWLYYLAYCEVGFRKRIINNLQLVLTRAGNGSLDEAPAPKAMASHA